MRIFRLLFILIVLVMMGCSSNNINKKSKVEIDPIFKVTL